MANPEIHESEIHESEVHESEISKSEISESEIPEGESAQGDIFDPESGNPLAGAFRKLREEGRGREAADLYHDILKPTEPPFVAHVERGVGQDELGHHELAIDEFLAAEEMDPKNVENLAQLAGAYGALGRFGEADAVIDRALHLDPANVHVRVGAAILAFRKGLYAAAEVQLQEICELDPSHGPAHFYRGEALNRLGRVEDALQAMERTIQLQPRNWRAYHTLGILYDRKEDRERASEMYRRALELKRP
jgi:tetratricopeptide (TPR) repeat protein